MRPGIIYLQPVQVPNKTKSVFCEHCDLAGKYIQLEPQLQAEAEPLHPQLPFMLKVLKW